MLDPDEIARTHLVQGRIAGPAGKSGVKSRRRPEEILWKFPANGPISEDPATIEMGRGGMRKSWRTNKAAWQVRTSCAAG